MVQTNFKSFYLPELTYFLMNDETVEETGLK